MADDANTQIVQNAVRFLAAQTDSPDAPAGGGFRPDDAMIGLFLAELPADVWHRDLTTQAAGLLLTTYREQLDDAGFDTTALTRLTRRGASAARLSREFTWLTLITSRTVTLRDTELKLALAPNDDAFDEIKEAVKALPGRRFDRAQECWLVPVDNAERVARLAGRYSFRLCGATYRAVAVAEEQRPEARAALEAYIGPDNDLATDGAWRIDLADDDATLAVHFPPPGTSEIAQQAKDDVQANGARFDRSARAWHLNLDRDPDELAALVTHLQHTYGFLLHRDARTAIDRQDRARDRARQLATATDADLRVPGLKGSLRGFQRAGVAYVRHRPKTLIADEMGLGKTIQALAAIEDQQAYPAIVIVPAAVTRNWRREAEAWLPDTRRVALLEGTTKRARRKAERAEVYSTDVIVASYDVAKGHRSELETLGARAVVLDEAHHLKNPKAKRTQAVRAIAYQAGVRLLLTGTAMHSWPPDLIEPLKLLGKLERFGGFWAFAERYCAAEETRFGSNLDGAANVEELAQQLRDVGFIRRLKQDVLEDLPANQQQVLDARIADTALSDHRQAMQEAAAYARRVTVDDAGAVEELSQPGDEIADRPATEARTDQAALLVAIQHCRRITALGKVDPAARFARETLAAGAPLVVFAVHEEAIDQLSQRLQSDGLSVATITGELTGDARQARVDRFQNGELDVLIGTIAAAGQGLTLTRASHVLFLEQAWRPADHDQAVDRLHRSGQRNAVNVYYLSDDRTVDKLMSDLVARKRQVVAEGTGDRQRRDAQVTTRELAQRLGGRQDPPSTTA